MTVWFTSDFHLGHENIITYCKRPFASVPEMDKVILDNLNACVQPDDKLYFLGDFCMGIRRSEFVKTAKEYRHRIRCRNIHFIWGNHDKRDCEEFENLFLTTRDLAEIHIEGRMFVLCHYALREWNGSHSGRSFQLYGHAHGNLREFPDVMNFDIGVDCWDFHPLSFAQVLEILEHKAAGGLARDLTIRNGKVTKRG